MLAISFPAYILASATSLSIRPLDPSKLHKMFTNKCTAAKAKKKETTGLHLTSATVGMHLGTVLGVQNSPIHQMLVMQFCRPNISLT